MNKHKITTAEILACALLELFPSVKLIAAGADYLGFYYDFIVPHPIDAQALSLLEERMRGIIKNDKEIKLLEMVPANASQLFQHHNQPVLAELVQYAEDTLVQIFQLGSFYDYVTTDFSLEKGDPKAFKLVNVEEITEDDSKFYRIHGIVSKDKDLLKKHVKIHEESKKYDHRLLCKQLDLVAFTPDIFWLANGLTLRDNLISWWKNLMSEHEFQLVESPLLVDDLLPVDRTSSHATIFKSKLYLHKDLPIRLAECAPCALSHLPTRHLGLFTSNPTLKDQFSILCSDDQVEKEIISSLQFFDKLAMMSGLKSRWILNCRGKKNAGILLQWDKCTATIQSALDHQGIEWEMNTEIGDENGLIAQAILKDSLGREWPGPSIQVDFNLPGKLGLHYQGADSKMHTPIMLVGTVFGSVERFLGVLLEHYKGVLPSWLTQGMAKHKSMNNRR